MGPLARSGAQAFGTARRPTALPRGSLAGAPAVPPARAAARDAPPQSRGPRAPAVPPCTTACGAWPCLPAEPLSLRRPRAPTPPPPRQPLPGSPGSCATPHPQPAAPPGPPSPPLGPGSCATPRPTAWGRPLGACWGRPLNKSKEKYRTHLDLLKCRNSTVLQLAGSSIDSRTIGISNRRRIPTSAGSRCGSGAAPDSNHD